MHYCTNRSRAEHLAENQPHHPNLGTTLPLPLHFPINTLIFTPRNSPLHLSLKLLIALLPLWNPCRLSSCSSALGTLVAQRRPAQVNKPGQALTNNSMRMLNQIPLDQLWLPWVLQIFRQIQPDVFICRCSTKSRPKFTNYCSPAEALPKFRLIYSESKVMWKRYPISIGSFLISKVLRKQCLMFARNFLISKDLWKRCSIFARNCLIIRNTATRWPIFASTLSLA